MFVEFNRKLLVTSMKSFIDKWKNKKQYKLNWFMDENRSYIKTVGIFPFKKTILRKRDDSDLIRMYEKSDCYKDDVSFFTRMHNIPNIEKFEDLYNVLMLVKNEIVYLSGEDIKVCGETCINDYFSALKELNSLSPIKNSKNAFYSENLTS